MHQRLWGKAGKQENHFHQAKRLLQERESHVSSGLLLELDLQFSSLAINKNLSMLSISKWLMQIMQI